MNNQLIDYLCSNCGKSWQGVAIFDDQGFLVAQGFDEIYRYIREGK